MDRVIKKKRFKLKYLIGLLIIGGAASGATYQIKFGDTSSRLNVKMEKIIISKVEKIAFREFIPVQGMVLPVTTVYLDAIEGGRVEKKYIEAGAWVKKGDPIIQLSNTNLVLNLMQREAEYFNQSDNLQKARLSLEQYKLNYVTLKTDLDYQIKAEKRILDQNTVLYNKKVIPKQQFIAARDKCEWLQEKRRLSEQNFIQETNFRKIQIEQLEASLKRMNSNLDIIKEKFEALTIKAPIKGQLTTLKAEIGESKALGQRIGQINVMTDLKVKAGIDEHYISRVKVGKKGTFEFANNTLGVEVNKIFPDVREGQFLVEMTFGKKLPEGIRIGQTLYIKLSLGELSEVIALPRGGFYQSTAGKWVYKLLENGAIAVKQPIRLGRQNADVFEVLSGLKPGDKVITSNYDNFEKMDKLVLK